MDLKCRWLLISNGHGTLYKLAILESLKIKNSMKFTIALIASASLASLSTAVSLKVD